jgi:hypothetical protein
MPAVSSAEIARRAFKNENPGPRFLRGQSRAHGRMSAAYDNNVG